MARFWNIRRDLDHISNEILDLLDSIHRHLGYEQYVNEDKLRLGVLNQMKRVDILDEALKCEKRIEVMEGTKKLLKLEGRR